MGTYHTHEAHETLADVARAVYADPATATPGYLWQYLMYANPGLTVRQFTVLPINIDVEFFEVESLPEWAKSTTPQTNARINALGNALANVTLSPATSAPYNKYRALDIHHDRTTGDFLDTDFLDTDWRTHA